MRKLSIGLCMIILALVLAACTAIKADLSEPLLPELEVPAAQPTATTAPATAAVQAQPPAAPQPAVNECVACHTSQEKLSASAKPQEAAKPESVGLGFTLPGADLEPWQKVFVNAEIFLPSVHGQIPCTECHQGVQSADKDEAHTGLITRPSDGATAVCAHCHTDISVSFPTSLHASQRGIWYALEMRSPPAAHPALEDMFSDNCASCHTSCGDCHISQPASVGGGLLDGHLFSKTPPMDTTCIACHGTRTGSEYTGKNQGTHADIHYRQGNMTCVDCHTSHELHGMPVNCDQCHDGPENGDMPLDAHRYDSVETPSCEACHPLVASGKDDVAMHLQHGADLSCQVCHATSYTSCDGCHVQVSQKTGNPYYTLQASYSTFLIGRNPLRTFDRPYKYVPVRHVPVTPDSFKYYGQDLLTSFDLLPTWAYATPHTIQIITPQNRNCNTCHGNAELFLTADKVDPAELEANLDVIVSEVPGPVEEPKP